MIQAHKARERQAQLKRGDLLAIAKLHEGEQRTFMPDMKKPENWFSGNVHFDKNKGAIITFERSTKPFMPDFPTAPRDEVLQFLEPLKAMMGQAISIAHKNFEPYFLEPKNLHPTLREIHRLLNLLAKHENTERMKQFWIELADLVCLGGFEDTAYLWRLQWAVERADIEKFKMTKEDRYWFKTRVDFDHGPT